MTSRRQPPVDWAFLGFLVAAIAAGLLAVDRWRAHGIAGMVGACALLALWEWRSLQNDPSRGSARLVAWVFIGAAFTVGGLWLTEEVRVQPSYELDLGGTVITEGGRGAILPILVVLLAGAALEAGRMLVASRTVAHGRRITST